VLGPPLAAITQLGGGLDSADGATEELQDPALVDELSRAVPEAVLGLLQSRG
jgi:hypothetical protein